MRKFNFGRTYSLVGLGIIIIGAAATVSASIDHYDSLPSFLLFGIGFVYIILSGFEQSEN